MNNEANEIFNSDVDHVITSMELEGFVVSREVAERAVRNAGQVIIS